MNTNLYNLFTNRMHLCKIIVLSIAFVVVTNAPTLASEITGDDGIAVQSVGPKARIISLAPSVTELLFHLGAGKQVVGRTDRCDYPNEALKVESIGSLFPPNIERIVRLKPDLILMGAGTKVVRDELRARGFKVYVINPQTLSSITAQLRSVGKLIGRVAYAEKQAVEFEAKLKQLKASVPKRKTRIYWEIWSNPMMTAGANTFVTDLIDHAGGKNIFGDLQQPWPKISGESVVRRQPELVFTVNKSAFISDTHPWSKLLNLPTSKVYSIADKDSVNRPSIRVLEGIEWLKMALENAR